jgi:hypothetical protein
MTRTNLALHCLETWRSVMFNLNVTVNYKDGNEKDWDHPSLSTRELVLMIEDYVDETEDASSFVFTISKRVVHPKHWVVVVFSDETEVFGTFLSKDDASQWAYREIGVSGWAALQIDEPLVIKPEHKVEGTQANFDRYVAGDR